MLIYNTTFQVDDDVHDNFMIWIKESYIPEIQKHGTLKAPRICRILSHREEGSAYSLPVRHLAALPVPDASDVVIHCFPPPIAKNTHFLLPDDLISCKNI